MQATALHFLVLTVAGWLQRRQLAAIEYLRAENQVLREQLGAQGLRLTDAQRPAFPEKHTTPTLTSSIGGQREAGAFERAIAILFVNDRLQFVIVSDRGHFSQVHEP